MTTTGHLPQMENTVLSENILNLEFKGDSFCIIACEIEGQCMFKAQDILDGIGMTTGRTGSDRVKQWKETLTSTECIITKHGGRYSGSYLPRDMATSFCDYLKVSHEDYQVSSRRVYAEKEHGALCAIEQILNVTLTRQYIVGDYRIDGYDEVNKVAYEIDERQHFTDAKLNKDCIERQKYIEYAIGCTFKRITV